MSIIEHEKRTEPEALAACRLMIREALCVHEALCQLGFSPRDIRVQLGHAGTPEHALFPERTRLYDVCVFVGVQDPSGLVGAVASWRLCVGPVYVDGVTFEREFVAAARAHSAMSHAQGAALYESSRARSKCAEFAMSLRARGIRIPAEKKT